MRVYLNLHGAVVRLAWEEKNTEGWMRINKINFYVLTLHTQPTHGPK